MTAQDLQDAGYEIRSAYVDDRRWLVLRWGQVVHADARTVTEAAKWLEEYLEGGKDATEAG